MRGHREVMLKFVEVHRGKRDVTAADKQEVIDSVNDYAAQTLAKVTALRCVKIELGELDKGTRICSLLIFLISYHFS